MIMMPVTLEMELEEKRWGGKRGVQHSSCFCSSGDAAWEERRRGGKERKGEEVGEEEEENEQRRRRGEDTV